MRTLTTLAATAASIVPLGSRRTQTRRRRDALGLGPSCLTVGTKSLGIGESTHAASFAVAAYPAEVGPGWLEPVLSYPARIDVAIHLEPVPAPVAADRLRKQRARIESGRRTSAERGRLDDPVTESAAADARELAYRVACGEGRLFDVGIYLTVFADSEARTGRDGGRGEVGRGRDAAAAGPGHVPNGAGLDDDAADRHRRLADPAHLRHRGPGGVLPVHLRPTRPSPGLHHSGTAGGERHRRRPGLLRPVGDGQPQLGRPCALRRGQVLPDQARHPALALPRRAGAGGGPGTGVRPAGRSSRRHGRRARHAGGAHQPVRPAQR